MTKTTEISLIKSQVELELTNQENVAILVSTTFKGLQPETMKRALMEGMMRGFTFRDFLEKNVYAVPFAGNYSLVTSIDYARKVGMRSGIVGKSAPEYVEQDKNIVSCSVTVKRKINEYVGDFTATVYFSEYTTGKNLWATKPRTMIAKVAEMHALRMACPEELAQSYVEEEVEKEVVGRVALDIDSYAAKIESAKDVEELKRIWSALPVEAKNELGEAKDRKKEDLTPKTTTPPTQEPVQPQTTPETIDDVAEQVAAAFGGEVVKEESDAKKKMREGMKKAKAV